MADAPAPTTHSSCSLSPRCSSARWAARLSRRTSRRCKASWTTSRPGSAPRNSRRSCSSRSLSLTTSPSRPWRWRRRERLGGTVPGREGRVPRLAAPAGAGPADVQFLRRRRGPCPARRARAGRWYLGACVCWRPTRWRGSPDASQRTTHAREAMRRSPRIEPIATDDLLSSGAVWWRGDIDDDRRYAWPSASAPSAQSGPCGARSRATTGDICASGVITKPGLRTSKPSAQHGV